jgi:hypothetical protein
MRSQRENVVNVLAGLGAERVNAERIAAQRFRRGYEGSGLLPCRRAPNLGGAA